MVKKIYFICCYFLPLWERFETTIFKPKLKKLGLNKIAGLCYKSTFSNISSTTFVHYLLFTYVLTCTVIKICYKIIVTLTYVSAYNNTIPNK